MTPSPDRRAAFTLVELLVVVAIVALLIAILLPALGRAREQSNAVACMSNLRQLYLAFEMFAADHNGHFPGNWWDGYNPDAEKRSWLRNSNEPFEDAPQNGTIFRYLGSLDVYRCPSLPVIEVGSGNGSNGRFDYAAVMLFSGAKAAKIKPKSKFVPIPGVQGSAWGLLDDPATFEAETPLIVEEEPFWGVNWDRAGGDNKEGGHCSMNRFAHTHRTQGNELHERRPSRGGGAHYAAVDGSVHYFREPIDTDCRNWFALSPGGTWISFTGQFSWGVWNAQ